MTSPPVRPALRRGVPLGPPIPTGDPDNEHAPLTGPPDTRVTSRPDVMDAAEGAVPEPQPIRDVWDQDRIQTTIQTALADARTYMELFIAPDRAEATRRYLGDPYGNEEPGRSQVISMDLRDTVMQ